MATNSISLSKYSTEDFDLFLALVQNEGVMKYISGKALTKPKARAKFESILAINDKDDFLGYFKIFNAKHEFIGDCKLERYPVDPTKLEIGYILKSTYWNQGYGRQICEKLLALAELHFPSIDIIGIIDPANIASRRLLEKNGFVSFFTGIEDDLPTEKWILKRTI